MNIVDFLDSIEGLCLEENEKENQLLSQKQNAKRSSRLGGSKMPFTVLSKIEKSKKQITFKLI